MIMLTIDQFDKWYCKRLMERSKDFVGYAKKSRRNVKHIFEDIKKVASDLENSARNDFETIRIASRFAIKLDDIVKNFSVAQDITYESTEAMQGNIQSFIHELWDAGSHWIRKMNKKYKNMIKLLDSNMKDLVKEKKVLNKLLYKFSWIKDLERVGDRIRTLSDLIYSAERFEKQIYQTQLKIDAAENEYLLSTQTYNEFTKTSNVAELLSLNEDLKHIASLLRMKLNPLKKQVKKFMQCDNCVKVSPFGQKALIKYFEDPLAAIIAEPDGTPGLIEGLEGLQRSLDTGRLKLKNRLTRRASEEIKVIKNGSMTNFQQQAKELDKKRQTFVGSDIYKKSAVLTERLNESLKNLEYHKNDLLKIEDDIRRQISRIEEFKTRIEFEILKLFEEKITIKIDKTSFQKLI
jgi:hypothetical protein